MVADTDLRRYWAKRSCMVVWKNHTAVVYYALQKHHVLSLQSPKLWPEQEVCPALGLCPQVQPQLSDRAAPNGQRPGWVRHKPPCGAEGETPIHLSNNGVSFPFHYATVSMTCLIFKTIKTSNEILIKVNWSFQCFIFQFHSTIHFQFDSSQALKGPILIQSADLAVMFWMPSFLILLYDSNEKSAVISLFWFIYVNILKFQVFFLYQYGCSLCDY